MTTSHSPDIDRVVRALIEARRNSQAADAHPLQGALNSATEAYAVQQATGAQLGLWQGPVAQHWKSGGASRGVDLAHAPLADAGIWQSPADVRAQGPWRFAHWVAEAEIALRLGRAVTAEEAEQLTFETAHDVIDAMAVSIEMVDSRWQQPLQELPALLKLADMQVHGALVLGQWRPYERRDWSLQRCRVRIGDKAPLEVQGGFTLDDPAWVLPQWLRHVTRITGTAPAGTVVTTGSWVGGLPASQGDLVVVDFEGVGSASVQL